MNDARTSESGLSSTQKFHRGRGRPRLRIILRDILCPLFYILRSD